MECDFGKKHLISGFCQLTKTMKELVPPACNNTPPNFLDALEECAQNFLEIKALKENIHEFQENFYAVSEELKRLKLKVRKTKENNRLLEEKFRKEKKKSKELRQMVTSAKMALLRRKWNRSKFYV